MYTSEWTLVFLTVQIFFVFMCYTAVRHTVITLLVHRHHRHFVFLKSHSDDGSYDYKLQSQRQ